MQKCQDMGNQLEDCCGKLPCHSKIKRVIDCTPASLLLNPNENIWSKVKPDAKSNIQVPNVVDLLSGNCRS